MPASARTQSKRTQMVIDGHFRCGRCKHVKPVACFSSSKKTHSGLSTTCKECDKQTYLTRKVEGKTSTDKTRAAARRWRRKNRAKVRAYNKAPLERNIHERLRVRLRVRLCMAMTRYRQSDGKSHSVSAVRDLGCSIEHFVHHIEGRFTDGMTWDNYGEWHIDHIVPLAAFDLDDAEQVKLAVHYTNLQPLWAKDNLSKGDRLPESITINSTQNMVLGE